MLSENPLERTLWHKYLTEKGRDHGIEYSGIYSPDLMKFEGNEMIDADFIFIFAANYGPHQVEPERKPIWKWYELPHFAKRFMDAGTKCGAIFDVEDNIEVGNSYPKEWFSSINDMDIMFTGVKIPEWSRFYGKPIRYIIEPKKMVEHSPVWKSGGNVAAIRHTPFVTSAEHTLDNVLIPFGVPYTYFHSGWSSAPVIPHRYDDLSTNSNFIWGLPWEKYLHAISLCYVAIDDNEGYYGWSRFGYECAMMGVPVIASDHAYSAIQFFPSLETKHRDYVKQKKLLDDLYSSPERTYKLAVSGQKKMKEMLDPDVCIERLKKAIEEVL